MKSIKISGYNGKYTVFENGIVINNLTGREIKQHDNGTGYMTVVLNKRKRYVHRLVALHFIPNADLKPQVNHMDMNRKNNHVSNLEWCTAQENMSHALLNGKRVIIEPGKLRGENHGRAKLNTEAILAIREALKAKQYTQKELGVKYGVSQCLICKIKKNILWKPETILAG